MNTYNYIALNAKGEQVEGTVSAESEAHAIQDLRVKGYYPTQIKIAGSRLTSTKKDRETITITLPRISFRDTCLFTLGLIFGAIIHFIITIIISQ